MHHGNNHNEVIMTDIIQHPPLELGEDHWRSRWLVTNKWDVLHRISTIEWEEDELISGSGISVCGIKDNFSMPGILSRMGLRRCPKCCALLEIPVGEGAPFNQTNDKWSNS
jgi:hypothetical protein